MSSKNSLFVNCCLPRLSKCRKIQIEKRVAHSKLQRAESQLMKSDVVFAFEQAGWPALVVDSAGIIRNANKAAMEVLGGDLANEARPFSAIWHPQNGQAPADFLTNLENSTVRRGVKVRTAGGT